MVGAGGGRPASGAAGAGREAGIDAAVAQEVVERGSARAVEDVEIVEVGAGATAAATEAYRIPAGHPRARGVHAGQVDHLDGVDPHDDRAGRGSEHGLDL